MLRDRLRGVRVSIIKFVLPAGARLPPLAVVLATFESCLLNPKILRYCLWCRGVPSQGICQPRGGALTSRFSGSIHCDFDGSVVSGNLRWVCEAGYECLRGPGTRRQIEREQEVVNKDDGGKGDAEK